SASAVETATPRVVSAAAVSVPVNGGKASASAPAVETGLGASLAAPVADSKGKRVNPIKRKQMEDRLHEIEEEITRTEAAIALYETQLQSFIRPEETQRQTEELG